MAATTAWSSSVFDSLLRRDPPASTDGVSKLADNSIAEQLYETIVAFRCRICRHVCTSVSDIVFHLRAVHTKALRKATENRRNSTRKVIELSPSESDVLFSNGAVSSATSEEVTSLRQSSVVDATSTLSGVNNTSVVVVRCDDNQTGVGTISLSDSSQEAERFVCSQCGRLYSTLAACEQHMREHSNTIRNDNRSVGSSGVSLLKKVNRNTVLSDQDSERFRVGTVSAVTASANADFDSGIGSETVQVEADSRPILFICTQPLCRRQFSNDQQRLVHEKCHMGAPPSTPAEGNGGGEDGPDSGGASGGNVDDTARPLFTCCKCSLLAGVSWSRVLTHLWRSHAVDAGLARCKHCSFRCALETNLARHIRVRHTPARHICRQCGVRFRRRDQLHNHKLTHTPAPSLGENTNSVSSVHSVLSASEQRRLCAPCGRVFSSANALHAHHRARHERVHGAHCCPVCSHTAATRHLLRLHVRGHSGQRPLVCTAAVGCTFRTRDPSALKKHQLRHTNIKPYSCTLCSYRSIQSSALKWHVRRHHGGVGLHCCTRCDFTSVNALGLHMHVAAHSCGERATPPVAAATAASITDGDGGGAAGPPDGGGDRQAGQYVFQIVPDEPKTEDRGGISIPAGEESGSLLSQFSG